MEVLVFSYCLIVLHFSLCRKQWLNNLNLVYPDNSRTIRLSPTHVDQWLPDNWIVPGPKQTSINCSRWFSLTSLSTRSSSRSYLRQSVEVNFTQFQRFDNNTYHAEPRACLRTPFCRIVEFLSKRFLPPSSPPSSRLVFCSHPIWRASKILTSAFKCWKLNRNATNQVIDLLWVFFVLMKLPKW